MLLETEGLILSSVKYGESSLITKVLTEKEGLISLISSRPKGKSRGNKSHLFQMPFSLVNIICYYKPNQQVHRIKDIQFGRNYSENPSHIIKSSLRYFIAELLSKIIREEEQNILLYGFLRTKCIEINNQKELGAHFLINFLCSLIENLGFYPDLNFNNNCFDLLNGEFRSQSRVEGAYLSQAESKLFYDTFKGENSLSRLERNQTLNNLLNYLSHQLDQEIKLKSKEVLELIFA